MSNCSEVCYSKKWCREVAVAPTGSLRRAKLQSNHQPLPFTSFKQMVWLTEGNLHTSTNALRFHTGVKEHSLETQSGSWREHRASLRHPCVQLPWLLTLHCCRPAHGLNVLFTDVCLTKQVVQWPKNPSNFYLCISSGSVARNISKVRWELKASV